jgi:cell division protein FtsZ
MLLQEGGENESVLDSFARADEWIGRGVKSIWAMLSKTGLINIDFSTLRQAFQQRGAKTLFGLGEGAGEAAAADAIASLKLCPLLHTPEFSRKADRLLVNITGGTDLTLPKVNEIMGAITEQFGRDSHIILGAVIDEACQSRIEVCVLGTSDMGTRGAPARRLPARARAPVGRAAPAEAPPARIARAEPALAESGPEERAAPPPKADQDEFGFGEVESRGHFEKTDRNLFDGQDLDVPTYLRKGIKIAI